MEKGLIDARAPKRTGGATPTPPRRWAVRLLRMVASGHALAAFSQAVLAGRFLSGDYAMLGLHAHNATLVGISGFLLVLAAALYWRPGRGPGWPALACVALSAAEVTQILLGYGRVLGVHVPLGVAIIATTLGLLIWAWRNAQDPVRPGNRDPR